MYVHSGLVHKANKMLALTISLLLVSYSSAACPNGWFAAGAHCFFISHGDEGVNWGEAETMCNLHGGALATFEGTQSHMDQNILQNIRQGNDKKIWIGATDDMVEGSWQWLPSGAVVSVSVHGNDKSKNCLLIDPDHHTSFYAEECAQKNLYMCELPNSSGAVNPAPVG